MSTGTSYRRASSAEAMSVARVEGVHRVRGHGGHDQAVVLERLDERFRALASPSAGVFASATGN